MSDQSVPYAPDGDMSVDAELEANSPSGALQDEQKEITAVEGTEEIIAAIEEPQGAASGETPTGSVSSPPPVPPAAATAVSRWPIMIGSWLRWPTFCGSSVRQSFC